MMLKFRLVFLLVLTLLVTSCEETGFKTGKTFIDGQSVDTSTLNLGRQVYIEYCMACHGMTGEGNGPASKGSLPPPRNFTQGLYKFGLSKDGGLPSDEDFARIIKKGLHGTGMLAWDIAPKQLYAVTQYLKTFAPQVWEKGDVANVGKKVQLQNDPWGVARIDSAVARGKDVYHAVTNCQSCHMAYVPAAEFNEINKRVTGSVPSEIDPTMYDLKIQDSEYFLYNNKDRLVKYLPPDFTWNDVRSAQSVEEIAYRLCAGVTGTGMPSWCGTVPDDDVWALSYYVRSLMDIKGNLKARTSLMSSIRK